MDNQEQRFIKAIIAQLKAEGLNLQDKDACIASLRETVLPQYNIELYLKHISKGDVL